MSIKELVKLLRQWYKYYIKVADIYSIQDGSYLCTANIEGDIDSIQDIQITKFNTYSNGETTFLEIWV